MKAITTNMLALGVSLMLCACASTTTITETAYNQDGSVASRKTTLQKTTDMNALAAEYSQTSKDSATALSVDFSRFNIGYNGYGLDWLSASLVRVKAPVATSQSNGACASDTALEKIAKCISSTKTNIQTSGISVNVPKDASNNNPENME